MTAPITLRLLLDQSMRGLQALERGPGDYTQGAADVAEDRVAGMLNPKTPWKWFYELVELLKVEGDEARAMVRQSHAEGRPRVRLQVIVAYQVEAALLRGHLLAASA